MDYFIIFPECITALLLRLKEKYRLEMSDLNSELRVSEWLDS